MAGNGIHSNYCSNSSFATTIMSSNNDDVGGLPPVIAAEESAEVENQQSKPETSRNNDDDGMEDAEDAGYDSERVAIVMSTTEDASDSPTDDEGEDINDSERMYRKSITDEHYNYNGVEESATTSSSGAGRRMNSSGSKVDNFKANSNISRSQQSNSQLSMAERCTSIRNLKQDEFVKNGARVKALISDVVRIVANGMMPTDATGDLCSDGKERNDSSVVTIMDSDNLPVKTRHTDADYAHVRTVARERSEECLALKRVRIVFKFGLIYSLIFIISPACQLTLQRLEGLQSQIDFFQNEISISHQTNTQLKDKIDHTLEALRHAGVNAANARAEADASNARADSLSSQLNDLQSVIEETKRGMEEVRREHDEVSRATRTVEGRLIQVESELGRAKRTKRDAIKDRDHFKARAESSEKIARELQDNVDDYHNEVRLLKKDLIEKEELEQIRAQRTRSIETEVEIARASLLEATSAAVEAESTVASLRSVIEVLQRENKTLHNQMNECRDCFAKDRSKLNEALITAEREAQKWKMKCEEVDEEIRKLTMDKSSAEKQVEQLRSRLESRRLNDSSEQVSQLNTTTPAVQAVTPHVTNNLGFINSFGAKDPSIVTNESKKRTYITELPMRDSSSNAQLSSSSRQLNYSCQKEDQDSASLHSLPKRPGDRINICCLCSKEGGMILKCQCDNINCDKRAHAICIGNFRSFAKEDSSRTILCEKVRCG